MAPKVALMAVISMSRNKKCTWFPAETQGLKLGYLDSNQEQLNQNQPCCQLHHTPMPAQKTGPTCNSNLPNEASTNRLAGRQVRDSNQSNPSSSTIEQALSLEQAAVTVSATPSASSVWMLYS